jgi:ribosomal protein RSM22 (predicted rRNA methylase)
MLIVEPSLQEDSRNLQKVRQALIHQGFYAWAPCTHQQACHLLEQSKSDWCHDKIKISSPPWFENLTERLPMHLNELGFSYLACSLDKPEQKKWGRVVGDPLEEKGKFRLLTCFDSSRIFISALRRKKTEISLMRGDLVELPNEISKHGNEIRTTEPIKLVYRN